MEDYALYVWMSYAFTAAVMVGLLLASIIGYKRQRAAYKQLEEASK